MFSFLLTWEDEVYTNFHYKVIVNKECLLLLLLLLLLVLVLLSTYKFKRALFRHGRRTAPTFGTHVWIETRLALTKKN